MPDQSPLINGKNYDWGDIQCVLFGVPIIGITEIEYTEDQDSVNNYGAGHEPVSYGNKNKIYAGSISIYTDELRNIMAGAPNRKILSIPPFTITVILAGAGVNTTTDKLKNVRFTKNPFAGKQNDSVIITKIPFIYAGLEQ